MTNVLADSHYRADVDSKLALEQLELHKALKTNKFVKKTYTARRGSKRHKKQVADQNGHMAIAGKALRRA